mgnify:CR=1 FL=1
MKFYESPYYLQEIAELQELQEKVERCFIMMNMASGLGEREIQVEFLHNLYAMVEKEQCLLTRLRLDGSEEAVNVIDELTQKNNIVLATGGGVIMTPENRNSLAARGTVIYLRTSLAQQFERTKRDTKRPLLRTNNLEGRLETLRDEREPFYEELADVSFETDKLTVKAVTNNIVRYIYGES